MRRTTSRRGIDGYRAPELLDDSNGSFSNKSDMWSLGCILFEMITGQQRFRSDYALVLYTVQKEPLFRDTRFLPTLSLLCVSEILQIDPLKRPSAGRYRRLIKIGRFVHSAPTLLNVPGNRMLSAISLSCLRGEMEQDIAMEIMEYPQSMEDAVAEALEMALTYGRDQIAEALRRCSRSDLSKALRYASYRGSASAVRFLLQQEIDINDPDEDGLTALDIAVMYRITDVVALLWESGAKCGRSSSKGVRELLAMENLSLEKILRRTAASVLPQNPREASWQISCTPLSADETTHIWSVVSVPAFLSR